MSNLPSDCLTTVCIVLLEIHVKLGSIAPVEDTRTTREVLIQLNVVNAHHNTILPSGWYSIAFTAALENDHVKSISVSHHFGVNGMIAIFIQLLQAQRV
jgi:hypothetical protein